MAAKRARSKPKSKSRTSGGGGFSVGKALLVGVFFLIVGVAGGYVWRSYYPLALPFESPLVSDKSSVDLEDDSLKEIARAATARAEAAERETKRLRSRIDELEAAQLEKEREMGDMQIRNILSDSN